VKILNQANAADRTGIELMPLGEGAVLVEFGKCISPQIHQKVRSLTNYLDRNSFPGMIEYVAAFASVTVFYDPMNVMSLLDDKSAAKDQTAYQIVVDLLRQIVLGLDYSTDSVSRVVEIPVCYGGEFGPDLAYVAEHNKLTVEEVIEIHTSGEYLVYMIGFAPGFPYLGGLSEKIATPRRQSPRTAIPAGSVGIAGMQTGAYPITTPGGWQLIGRTPVALFRPQEDPPSLLQAGDTVKFRRISYEEYEAYRGEQA
jgi:inhibitor of KinA